MFSWACIVVRLAAEMSTFQMIRGYPFPSFKFFVTTLRTHALIFFSCGGLLHCELGFGVITSRHTNGLSVFEGTTIERKRGAAHLYGWVWFGSCVLYINIMSLLYGRYPATLGVLGSLLEV